MNVDPEEFYNRVSNLHEKLYHMRKVSLFKYFKEHEKTSEKNISMLLDLLEYITPHFYDDAIFIHDFVVKWIEDLENFVESGLPLEKWENENRI